MKIRNKISLWIALLALTLAAFSGFLVFFEMRDESFELIDRELLDLSERSISYLTAKDHKRFESEIQANRYFIKIADSHERILYRSPLAEIIEIAADEGKTRFLITVSIPYNQLWLPPADGDDLEELKHTDAISFRVVIETKQVSGETFLVTVAKPLPFLAEDFREVSTQIIIWSIAGALLVICLSYLLAGKILSPLNMINMQVRDINTRSLTRKIPVKQSEDEISELIISLNSMFDRLHHSFERQREFIGNAAHEIKTPITTLLIGYENLLNKSLSDEVRADLENQLHVVRRVSLLVKNLLDISRLEQQESLNRETFDLVKLINEVIAEFDNVTAGLDIVLKNDSGNIEYHGDKSKIKRMLINIIDNAIKYNLSSGFIEISTGRSQKKAVIIKTSNASASLSPTDLQKLFEQFYRADTSHSSQIPGFGLGLTIVQRIVLMHGGKISVSHSRGITTVSIVLPMQ